MLFPTVEFSLFFLITFSIWLLIPSSENKSKNIKWLILFNLFFYGFYKPEMLLYLLSWVGLVWLSGKYLQWRYIIIGFAVLQLVFFKSVEAGFIEYSPIATPLGISFFTFQGLTYLFARMKLPQNKKEEHINDTWSFSKLFAFIGFFPTVFSGPILKAKYWENQLENPTLLTSQTFNTALKLITLGLFYKLCLASIFHDYVALAFANPKDESGINLMIGMYAYTFELYHDFAGYSLMSIGVALLYGFKIPDNFKQPYLSLNIREFWQKWHISFSNWLRDYVYISLGGSRVTLGRHLTNTMIVMLACGAWHGLSANYIVWGLLHGVAICFFHVIKDKVKMPALLAWFITFNYVALAWIFFRSPSLEVATEYLITMFNINAWSESLTQKNMAIIVLFIVAFIFQYGERKFILVKDIKIQNPLLIALFWSSIIVLILILSPSGMPPFIYFSY